MKKTLIASAVAAATLSSTAFAMDPANEMQSMMDAMPTLSGNIQLAYVNNEMDNGTSKIGSNETYDNGSTIRITHDHEISAGVTGFLKMEYDVDADDKGNTNAGGNSQFKLDEGYIGVKGDFGSVQLGSDDTVYEWVDVLDMYEAVGLEGELAGFDEGDNVQYVSPDMSGLTVGVTAKLDSDTNDSVALAAKYTMDTLEVVAAYAMGREEGALDKGDSYGLAVSYGIEDLTLSLAYESKDEDKVANVDANNEETYIGFLANYSMGANNFALGYAMFEVDNATDDEADGIYAQALHNVSDNMYVYVEYLAVTDSDNTAAADVDDDSLAIGATYTF